MIALLLAASAALPPAPPRLPALPLSPVRVEIFGTLRLVNARTPGGKAARVRVVQLLPDVPVDVQVRRQRRTVGKFQLRKDPASVLALLKKHVLVVGRLTLAPDGATIVMIPDTIERSE